MARPQTKEDLLNLSEENYQKLVTLVGSFSTAEQLGTFPFEDRDRTIRDVIVHLYEWQLMMEEWYQVGMAGGSPEMPAKGYTWRTTSELNQVIWQKYQAMGLEAALSNLAASHQRLTQLIEAHSNTELFQRKQYKWTNTTTLGAYFISATSSHYEWALKKIRKYQRQLKQKK